jgi:hypothetical protein
VKFGDVINIKRELAITELAQRMIDWQMENGESFTDYFTNVYAPSFMYWCMAKGYLTKEKFNMWEEAFMNKKHSEADSFNDFLYNQFNDEDAQFAVVISEDYNEEDEMKAFRIFAEFCLDSSIYMKRLEDFFKGKDWSTEYVQN